MTLSNELDLPLNVHSRSWGRHTIAFLRERGARRVLMHAFDGRAVAALEGVQTGYFFSIPPSVVRSAQKQKLAEAQAVLESVFTTDQRDKVREIAAILDGSIALLPRPADVSDVVEDGAELVEGALQFAPPLKLSEFDFAVERAAPDAGEHTDEILREIGEK